MTTHSSKITLKETREHDIVDITQQVSKELQRCSIKDGIAHIFVAGSTGSIMTLEYEPGLIVDIPAFLNRVIPKHPEITYEHEMTWHDGNGHSHVRASLLGPGLTVPFRDKQLVLGTWQQIAFIELDIKIRHRSLFLTFIGD